MVTQNELICGLTTRKYNFEVPEVLTNVKVTERNFI